jgi:hypothetical protein
MLKQLQQSLSALRVIMTINAVNTDGTVTASNHGQTVKPTPVMNTWLNALNTEVNNVASLKQLIETKHQPGLSSYGLKLK